jgi:hypothetical protein
MEVPNKTSSFLKSLCWLTMPATEFMTLFSSGNTQDERNNDEQNSEIGGGGLKKI